MISKEPGTARRLFRLLGLWALAALASPGCTEKPIVVGAVLPLTGNHAVYGLSLRRGMETAESVVNRSGGVSGRPLSIQYRDTGSSSQAAAQRMRELIDRDQVSAVLGGATSGETLAMAPLAESYHRVLLSPSASSPLVTDSGEFVFRVWPSDHLEAAVMADFAAYTLRALRVLVVSSESPYADGVRSSFTERFTGPQRRVETLVAPAGGSPWEDLASQARELRGKVQCLYVVGYENELQKALPALRREGLDVPTLTVSAAASAEFPAKLGPDAEGILFPSPRFDATSSDEPVRRFAGTYRKRFGGEPDIYAAHGYDAAMVLASVMGTQGTRPESIQRGLLALRNYAGATGPITFDPKGDVVQPIQIWVILGGKARPLSDVQEEVLPPLQKRVEDLRFGKR